MKTTIVKTTFAISFSLLIAMPVMADQQFSEAEMQQEMRILEMAEAAEPVFSSEAMVDLIDEMASYQGLCPLGGVTGKMIPVQGGQAIVISCLNGEHFDKFIIDEAVEDVFFRWGFLEEFVNIGIGSNGLINEITILPHEFSPISEDFMRDYGEPKNQIPEVAPLESDVETPRYIL